MATGSDFESQSQSAKPVHRIDISTVDVGSLNWLSIGGALGFINPAIVKLRSISKLEKIHQPQTQISNCQHVSVDSLWFDEFSWVITISADKADIL